MITLHLLAQSRALRIVWLLEELGLDYQLKQYARDSQTLLAPDSLKQVHPLGKSPILQDGEQVLTESGMITDYLISRYGQQLMPEYGSADYWAYQRWLHYAEASLMPLLLMSLVFQRVESSPMPFFVRPIARKISGSVKQSFLHPQLALHLAHVERELTGKTWLMGEKLSGADIMMSYPLQAARMRLDMSQYPQIARYLAQIEQGAAYQRAVEKAGEPLLKLK
ncbi:glutathione S-transferase [Pasteurellaceae bacterium RH1A]|nr:glutathione S-transferase [Pasteurellaceae bacterium RH1A]